MLSRSNWVFDWKGTGRAPLCSVLVWLTVIIAGCNQQGTPTNPTPVGRPRLAPAYAASWDPQPLIEATRALGPTDPDLCPTPTNPDPEEAPIGALSSRSVLNFANQPTIQNLYARLILTMKLCTGNGSTLSSADRSAFTAVLNALKITNARSFVATIEITGNGNGGVKYPQLVPFSYKYDESTSTYTVQTIGQAVTPWQVASSFGVNYSYSASKSVAIDTASLFTSIATSISGAGSATALLSPAANAYLSVGNTVLKNVADSMFKAINNGADTFQIDILGQQNRSVTYRFKDLSKPSKPLAAVRLAVVFTNSIQNPIPIDATAGGPNIPQFTELQDILGVSTGGPLMGTLGQAISKEASYQNLLKSTADTTAASFAGDCNTLEGNLKSVYGLNEFDAALTMGEILSQNTLYLSSKKFYDSGCFKNRGKLKLMGINEFEKPPQT